MTYDWQKELHKNECHDLIRKLESEHSGIELQRHLEGLKEYSVGIIEEIRENKEFAFEKLIMSRDIRNFCYYYAYHIAKYHNFYFTKEETLVEIYNQLFLHLKRNYRVYDEPHEFSLIINSMRGWIRYKVSNALVKVNSKMDRDTLEHTFIEEDVNYSDFEVDELAQKVLNEEEYSVFTKRFFDYMIYKDIGRDMGYSKDSAQRTYFRALEKIKDQIEKENK